MRMSKKAQISPLTWLIIGLVLLVIILAFIFLVLKPLAKSSGEIIPGFAEEESGKGGSSSSQKMMFAEKIVLRPADLEKIYIIHSIPM